MDSPPNIAQAWGTMALFIPLTLLIALVKSPWAKGHIGELLVRLFAHWQLDKSIYRRLHNITLNTPDGTTQIDHAFLSRYGIFVLETKNMRDWIYGGEKQAQWTQKIYKHTYKFQNPLQQNYKHLKALENTLGIAPNHLHSVVTFVGGSTLKTEVPDYVTQGIGFIRYIKSFQRPVFREAEVDAMLNALHTGRRRPSLATHREHVQNLKRCSDPAAERQCPKCGSASDSHSEIRPEDRAAVLGLLESPPVPSDAEPPVGQWIRAARSNRSASHLSTFNDLGRGIYGATRSTTGFW